MTRSSLLIGEIADSPSVEVTLLAPGLGRVTDIIAVGVQVQPGDLVATVEAPTLRSPASDERHDALVDQVGRLRLLEAEGLVASAELQRAESELSRIRVLRDAPGEMFEVRADESGQVVEVMRPTGAEVDAGAAMLRLRRPGTLEVVARVDEPMAAGLEPGAPAVITVTARPGDSWEGALARLRRGENRSLEVVFRLDGDVTSLLPGLTASIEATWGEPYDALTVPASAIVVRNGRSHVVVRTAGRPAPGVIHVEVVKTRGTNSGRGAGPIEIIGGLPEDAEIAVEGAALLVPPATPADSSAEQSWLVVPRGRGGRLASLVGDRYPAVRRPGDGPTRAPGAGLPAVRIRLDAREMSFHGVTLQAALRSIDRDAPTLLPGVLRESTGPLHAALWRPGQPRLEVDALPVAAPATRNQTNAFSAAAHEIDPGVEWIGQHGTGGRSPALLAAGLLLLLLGTGSIRASAIAAAGGIALAGWSGETGPQLAAAAVAPATALLVVLGAGQLGEYEKLNQIRALRQAIASSVVVLTPTALVTLARYRTVDSLLLFPVALAVAALAATVLAGSMRLVPTGGSFGPAPIERLPVVPVIVVLAATAAATTAVAPAASTTTVMAVGGEPDLSSDELVNGLDHVARGALGSGARRVLAARDEAGQLHFAISGPGSDVLARRALEISPPGLSLGRLPAGQTALHRTRFTAQLPDDGWSPPLRLRMAARHRPTAGQREAREPHQRIQKEQHSVARPPSRPRHLRRHPARNRPGARSRCPRAESLATGASRAHPGRRRRNRLRPRRGVGVAHPGHRRVRGSVLGSDSPPGDPDPLLEREPPDPDLRPGSGKGVSQIEREEYAHDTVEVHRSTWLTGGVGEADQRETIRPVRIAEADGAAKPALNSPVPGRERDINPHRTVGRAGGDNEATVSRKIA